MHRGISRIVERSYRSRTGGSCQSRTTAHGPGGECRRLCRFRHLRDLPRRPRGQVRLESSLEAGVDARGAPARPARAATGRARPMWTAAGTLPRSFNLKRRLPNRSTPHASAATPPRTRTLKALRTEKQASAVPAATACMDWLPERVRPIRHPPARMRTRGQSTRESAETATTRREFTRWFAAGRDDIARSARTEPEPPPGLSAATLL